MPRLTPEDLARYRTTLYAGDQLDAGVARRLVEEVESSWADLRRQRVEFATKASGKPQP